MKFIDSAQPRIKIKKEELAVSKSPVDLKQANLNRSIFKIVAALLIFALNGAALLSVSHTFSYFNDTERSLGNFFGATILDLGLSTDPWLPAEAELNLAPDDTVTRHVDATNSGILPFQYNASSTVSGPDLDLCAAIALKVKLNNTEIYSGNLESFFSATSSLGFVGSDSWDFEAALPFNAPDSLQNKTCNFKFIFSAWQNGFPPSDGGFVDVEEVDNTLKTGTWITTENNTSQYRPIADSYINQVSPEKNFGSNSNLIIKSRNSDRNFRTFIRFDFHFPAETIINYSSLNLFMHGPPTANSRFYEARSVLVSWEELGITWNNQPAASGTPIAITSTGANTPQWLSWNVLDDVRSFMADSAANYGWRLNDSLESEGPANSDWSSFYSRHNTATTTTPFRPYLEVGFTTPAATTTHVVINEVYYNVDTSSKGTNNNNQWVEVYNPTASAVDISGWQICDNSTCDIIPASTPLIPAKGFAIIANNASTWNTYWTLPSATIKIALGSPIGNRLDISPGDRLILKDAGSATIDAMSWGNDASQLNPAVPVSLIGNSLARIIKGYDNDSANDWVINVAPNPGTNPSGKDGTEIMRFTDRGILVAGSLSELEQLVVEEAGKNLENVEIRSDTENILSESKENELEIAGDEIVPEENQNINELSVVSENENTEQALPSNEPAPLSEETLEFPPSATPTPEPILTPSPEFTPMTQSEEPTPASNASPLPFEPPQPSPNAAPSDEPLPVSDNQGQNAIEQEVAALPDSSSGQLAADSSAGSAPGSSDGDPGSENAESVSGQ
jgi:hypothetical protein